VTIYVVLENPNNWQLQIAGVEVVAAREYVTNPRFSDSRRAKVFNLCRRYGYQTLGYYVSLLAEARGHRPIPSVATLQDLRLATVLRIVSDELDEVIQKSLSFGSNGARPLRIYFGASPDPGMDRLARTIFNYFPCPLLQADFTFQGKWRLDGVRPIATSEIPSEERGFVAAQASKHFQRRAESFSTASAARYDLAILFNPHEVDAPSDERAIQKFIRAAKSMGLGAEVIGREDFAALAEYDALFIRETTAVDHHTYRFARRAQAEGLVVMDAPEAIARCTNKVYLAELFERSGIPSPRTRIVHRDNCADRIGAELGFPVVLKRPDSSFSQGVVKASDELELRTRLAGFLEKSELVVAQEYVPTPFDWRIGVLDRRFLYGCKYHMAPGHWQIRRSDAGPRRRFGAVEAVPAEAIPSRAIELAVRAAGLIGDGLFGVDVKEAGERFLVMEVNDNPNLEAGHEDGILRDDLYLRVMRWFLERLERRGRQEAAS
jgi:glutathione synthase/RimK-type ligase-like ATP-grasp enzyme